MGNLPMYIFNVFGGSKDNNLHVEVSDPMLRVKSLLRVIRSTHSSVGHIQLYIYYLCSAAHAQQPDLTDFIGCVSWRKVYFMCHAQCTFTFP